MTQAQTRLLRNPQPLDNDTLRRYAPSVFAEKPWERMSAKYTYIPTINVVNAMRREGLLPVSVTESRSRIEGRQGFVRHQIRFRDMRHGDAPVLRELGALYPEIVFTNSHDGASRAELMAGLFRLICLNGAVVADGTLTNASVRHTGNADKVIEASYEIIDQFPQMLDNVQKFSQIQLAAPEQQILAEAALQLRYETPDETPITVEQALKPRRYADSANPNLWNTYNVLQENLTKGGLAVQGAKTRRSTRAVNGITENNKLNKGLWTLMTKMAELKTA